MNDIKEQSSTLDSVQTTNYKCTMHLEIQEVYIIINVSGVLHFFKKLSCSL